MSRFKPTRSSVEEYIEHLERAKKVGAANVPTLSELDRTQYASAVEFIEYWRYAQSADYHYFISRVLFLRHLTEYSLFAGHQVADPGPGLVFLRMTFRCREN